MRFRTNFALPVAVQEYSFHDCYSCYRPFLPGLFVIPSETSVTRANNDLPLVSKTRDGIYILHWVRLLLYLYALSRTLSPPAGIYELREVFYQKTYRNFLEVDLTRGEVVISRLDFQGREVEREVVLLPKPQIIEQLPLEVESNTPYFTLTESGYYQPTSVDVYTALTDTVRYIFAKTEAKVNTLEYLLMNRVCLGRYKVTSARKRMVSDISSHLIQVYLSGLSQSDTECLGKWADVLLTTLV